MALITVILNGMGKNVTYNWNRDHVRKAFFRLRWDVKFDICFKKNVCDVCWKIDLSCALHKAAEGNGKGHR